MEAEVFHVEHQWILDSAHKTYQDSFTSRSFAQFPQTTLTIPISHILRKRQARLSLSRSKRFHVEHPIPDAEA